METTQGERELVLALEAKQQAQQRFEAAVGTSTEMGSVIRDSPGALFLSYRGL